MTQFCTGIPGSGKSYYGVFYIAIHFFNDEYRKKYSKFSFAKKKYKHCYTNINELKLDSFEGVEPLKYQDFYKIVKGLHNLYKLGKNDTELLEYADKHEFSYSLIVLDECHNYFDKADPVLIWWVTYHRHLFQDIIFLTQSLNLVNGKYKEHTDFYYKALPSSSKLFNNKMIYHRYKGPQLFKTQKAETKKIPIIQDFFNLYGSGDNNTQKSTVRYFIYIAMAFLALLVVIVYFFISSKNKDVEELKNNEPLNNTSKNISKPTLTYEKDFTDSSFYEMICNKNLCFVNGNIFERSYIFHVLNKEYETKFIKIINSKYLFKTTDEYNLFKNKQKGTENENNLLNGLSSNFNNS